MDGGPLETGHYRLEAFAQQHFPGRVEFDFDGMTNEDVGPLALNPSPVELAFQCCPSSVPSTGGPLKWKFRLTNVLGGEPLKVQAYSVVHSDVSETGFFTDFQVGKKGNPTPANVTLPGNVSLVVEQEIHIPPEVADGCCICVKINVIEPKNPFAPLGQAGFCVPKGANTTTPPGPPPPEMPHMHGRVNP